jgi:hypothetical protein
MTLLGWILQSLENIYDNDATAFFRISTENTSRSNYKEDKKE